MLDILRPRTLQLYILREFGIAFGLALAACTLFMLLGIFFMKAADYEEFGVTLWQVALLSPYLMPKALALAVPLAAMIAVTTVFGRMSAENEILAAQAGGAPLRALALPILLCGCALSVFGLWCTQGGLRWGSTKIRNEVFKIDNLDFFASLEKPGNSASLTLENGVVVRINWLPWVRDPETQSVRRPIHIAYFQNQEAGRMVLAKDYTSRYDKSSSGSDRILTLTLKDARVLGERSHAVDNKSNHLDLEDMKSFCSESTLEISLPPPSKIVSLGDTRGERGWMDNYELAGSIGATLRSREAFALQRAAELGAHIVTASPADPAAPCFCAESWHEARISSEAIGGAYERALAEEADGYRKVGLGVLSLSMVVLGIGLGLLVQKSQRLIGFLLGIVVYALLYYPLMILSKELAREGRLPAWTLFVSNLVLLLLGYALWRAYERGSLGALPGRLAVVGATAGQRISGLVSALRRPFSALREYGAGVCGKKVDGYIAASFVGPLLVVLLVVAALLTSLDLVEHGNEVIEGVMKARDPLPGLPWRMESEAILDIGAYYCIRALEIICDLLPLLVLLAGVLCITALVRNNEHLILKSSGVPLQRAFRPIILVSLVFSLGVAVLRETEMPSLIMTRDHLRPLVYRRAPSPTALAFPTLDAFGRQVLFQMSQYDSLKREGRNLRIYQVTEQGRMPLILADRARWNGRAWQLETEPPAPLLAKGQTEAKGAEKPKQIPCGYQISPEEEPADGAPDAGAAVRPVRTAKTEVAEWRGAVTPPFLECERLGAGVMGLRELAEASKVKPELKVEGWRRLAAAAMSVFLLWLAIPLLVSETRGPVWGVGLSILIGAAYWGLSLACMEGARRNLLPVWAPLIVTALFCALGLARFYRGMAT